MANHNPKNERIKREYLTYLREAKRQSEATVDSVAATLARFEAYTRFLDFKAFHYRQAVAFKHHLAAQMSSATGEKLSKATQHAVLAHLKRFFQWLAGRPGFKSSIQYSDAEYFNLPDKESRIATARRPRPAPTLEQVRHTIRSMPTGNELQLRDRALVAFVMLTGARDSAVASIKLKHVDLDAGAVHQDARDVRTKFSKTFTTFFFPVGPDIRQIVSDWVTYLREVKLWGNDDPLFPRTLVAVGADGHFAPLGLQKAHWSNATPIRKVFRDAFEAAGLPYFNPHSLRSTLACLGERLCQTPEAFKAWSQNLGHEQVLTTFTSYGQVATARQGEIIEAMARPPQAQWLSSRALEGVLALLGRLQADGVLGT
jgi:integrase